MLSIIVGGRVVFTRFNSVMGWEELIEYYFSLDFYKLRVKIARETNCNEMDIIVA